MSSELRTKLIVGLGNPGRKYQNNRHNLGFMVLDGLALKLGVGSSWFVDKKTEREFIKVSQFRIRAVAKAAMARRRPNSQLILMKPQVFMNECGKAVKKVRKEFSIDNSNLWVVHDDLDLPFLGIRMQKGRGSAGHKGVQSVIDGIGEGFLRFRIGVGRPKKGEDPDDYLLSNFSRLEKSLLKKTIGQIVKVVVFALEEGWEKAASKFSGQNLGSFLKL